jgi:hypothetical protein
MGPAVHSNFVRTLGLFLAWGCGSGPPTEKASPLVDSNETVDSGISDTGSSSTVRATITATPGTDCAEEPNAWPVERWSDPVWLDQYVTPETTPLPTSSWGVAIADYDGNGLLDIHLPQLGYSQLYLNRGERVFEEVSETNLPNQTVTALAAVAADLDEDGDIDIVETGFGMVRLLINDGTGRFSNGPSVSTVSDTLYFGSSWADMDGDGDLDGIIAGFPSNIPSMEEREAPGHLIGAPDILLERVEGGWNDASHRLPDTNDGYTFLAAWQDLDGDQRPEILVMNDYFISGRSNRVWTFNGESFEDTSDAYGLNRPMESMGLAISDANGDRQPDMLVTGWGELNWMVSDPNGGPWIDRGVADGYSLATGTGQWVGWGADFADLDNDGSEEAMVSFGFWELAGPDDDPDRVNAPEQPDALYAWGEGSVNDAASLWGLDERSFGRGLATADLDRDGCIDIIRRPVFGPATIDSPRCTENHWVTVSLRMPTGNRFAIGARITVEADGHAQTRWIRAGGTGLASGGPPEAHIGVGNSTAIDRIIVDWPDGEQTVHTGIPTDSHIGIARE